MVGVYEPAVVLGADGAQITSIAREPLLRDGHAQVMHLDCGRAAPDDQARATG